MAAAADVNKDGYVDMFFARAAARRRTGHERRARALRGQPADAATAGARAAQFVDYDNDGLLDLVAVTPRRTARDQKSGQPLDGRHDGAIRDAARRAGSAARVRSRPATSTAMATSI